MYQCTNALMTNLDLLAAVLRNTSTHKEMDELDVLEGSIACSREVVSAGVTTSDARHNRY